MSNTCLWEIQTYNDSKTAFRKFSISYMDVKESWGSTISCYAVQRATVILQLQVKSDQQENAQLRAVFWCFYFWGLKPLQYV